MDLTGTSRFYVSISGHTNAVFTEIGGLQVETEVFEYKEGGLNDHIHRFPGRSKVGNITLKRGMAKDDKLFQWYLKILLGNIEKKNITITAYDVSGEIFQSWEFMNAFPVKWVGPQLSAGANSLAIDTLELAHAGLIGK